MRRFACLLLAAATFAACSDDPPAAPQLDAAAVGPDAGMIAGADSGEERPDAAEAAPEDAAVAPGPDAGEPREAAAPGADAATVYPRPLRGKVVLGAGGFFGTSARDVGRVSATESMFAIGAHYAELPAASGADKHGGRVYLFRSNALPGSMADAVTVLEPPDLAVGGGFGYALGNACDLNKDGFPDLPIGNHLWSSPTANNCGRGVVFWGDASGRFSMQRTTSHTLAAGLQAGADSLSQTVLCADLDSDGADDLLLTGQNGGPSDTGIGAIYKGGLGGLPATQSQALYPDLAANKQYFGAASLFDDLDGDGRPDLAIGAWGLIKGPVTLGPHTGGVAIFKGGADWSKGPSSQMTPPGLSSVNLGSRAIHFSTGKASFLAVAAPKQDGEAGAIHVYRTGSSGFAGQPAVHVLVPPGAVKGTGFGSDLAWIPDYFKRDEGALLVGMKWGDVPQGETGAGTIAVFSAAKDGLSLVETPTLLVSPTPKGGDGFGAAIAPLPDLDGDGLRDFLVGIPEHLEGDMTTGTQTGGVVFFH